MIRLADLVDTSEAVRGTASRLEKRDLLVALFRGRPSRELELAASYLAGEIPCGPLGVGWRQLSELSAAEAPERLPLFSAVAPPEALPPVPSPQSSSSLPVTELEGAFERLAGMTGTGSRRVRQAELRRLFAPLEDREREFLARLILGEMRQGALRALVVDAVAATLDLDGERLRRAIMLAGSFPLVVGTAAREGEPALDTFQLQPLTPIEPMLASTADVGEILARWQSAAVEWKFDGVRVQLHRDGNVVRVFTRALRDVTASLPELTTLARELGAERFVLDGEAMAYDTHGRPVAFQDLVRLVTRKEPTSAGDRSGVRSVFFDLLLLGDVSLVDAPYHERRARLEALVGVEHCVAMHIADDPEAIEKHLAASRAAGHEGLVLKKLDAPYQAGRRGAQWIKVKEAVTLDLVILAAEWGSGRRRGYLSNIHLGARVPGEPGRFAMLGKTFKGLTDDMLESMTDDLQSIETARRDHVVHVEPLRVVEIAFDNVQRSKRYDSGMALRFARVKRFRPDKQAAEAATVDEVRAYLPG